MGNTPRGRGPGEQCLAFIFIWWGIVLGGEFHRTISLAWIFLLFAFFAQILYIGVICMHRN